MRKRFGIKSLLVLTAIISVICAASIHLSSRINSFRNPSKETQTKLMDDANILDSHEFVLSSVKVKMVERSVTDYLSFSRRCEVSFSASTLNPGVEVIEFARNTYDITFWGSSSFVASDKGTMIIH